MVAVAAVEEVVLSARLAPVREQWPPAAPWRFLVLIHAFRLGQLNITPQLRHGLGQQPTYSSYVQYNGKLRCAELLLREDGSVVQIRRAETIDDYFATLDFSKL